MLKGLIYLGNSAQKHTLSVVKMMIVQEKHQMKGLKEKVDIPNMLEDYISQNGKPEKIMVQSLNPRLSNAF